MAEALVELPNVARLSSRVLRILGQNPGKFTLQGTNTYLISPPETSSSSSTQPIPTILVDTAEGDDAYIKLIEDVLSKPPRRHISHVLLTHWHHDHVAGLAPLLENLARLQPTLSPPRVYKLPNSEQDSDIEASVEHLTKGKHFTPPPSSRGVLHHLQDLEAIPVGDDASLQCLHTPGHTSDHLSLLLKSHDASPVFFSGDNVLGQGTAVFEDLAAYLNSLKRSLGYLESQTPVFPAHGPVIDDGRKAVEMYIDHRLQRERQVVELLAKESPTGKRAPSGRPQWSCMDLVKDLYAQCEWAWGERRSTTADSLRVDPPSLYPAAARGLFLHLHKLATESRVKCSETTPPAAPFMAEYVDLEWSLADGEESGGGGEGRL